MLMCPLTDLLPVARHCLRKLSQKLFFLVVWMKESVMATRGNFKIEVPTPKDFTFCMQTLHIWKDQKTKEWCQNYGNIYFHFTMSWVKKHNSGMTVEDVTITGDTFNLLKPNHLCLLHHKGFLETIVTKLTIFYHSSKYEDF